MLNWIFADTSVEVGHWIWLDHIYAKLRIVKANVVDREKYREVLSGQNRNPFGAKAICCSVVAVIVAILVFPIFG